MLSTIATLSAGVFVGFMLAALLRRSSGADERDTDRWVALVFSGWQVAVPRGAGHELVSGAELERAVDELIEGTAQVE